MTFTRALSTNNYGPAKFIVDGTTTANGTHSTIATALTSAVSGDTIFIRPGTYTENLTLKAGVNLTAFTCDAFSPNVTIVGNCTATFAGACSISGIRFQTNGAALLTVSGSAATIVNIENCYFNCTNATGISFTTSSASAEIVILYSRGDLAGIGSGVYSSSSAGTLRIEHCEFTNTGSSTTASTNSAGTVRLTYCNFHSPLSNTSTGNLYMSYVRVDTLAQNAAALVFNGAGSTANFMVILSGTGLPVSVGAGTTLIFSNSLVTSTNANCLTGAGQCNYVGISFADTAHNINPTTPIIHLFGPNATCGEACPGLTNTFKVANNSNTASSQARILANVAGGTAGDAFYQSAMDGGQNWTWGLDNSDSDAFALSSNATLGTTNVMRVAATGEINYPLQSAFSAYLSAADVLNVTGDGTAFTLGTTTALTEIFDQNSDFNTNGTFTAPVTGRYFFNAVVRLAGIISTHTSGSITIVTTNRDYVSDTISPFACGDVSGNLQMSVTAIADMDATETATISFQVSNGTKVVDLISSANFLSGFSGYLLG